MIDTQQPRLRVSGAPHHPATSFDRVYDMDEAEFLRHVEDFKKRTGKKFLTLTEIFHAGVRALGYTKEFGGMSLDSSPLYSILRIDNNGKILGCNSTAKEQIGEVVGMRLDEVLDDSKGDEIRSIIGTDQSANVGASCCVYGGSKWFRVTLSRVRNGHIVVMELIDLSQFVSI